MPEDPIYLSVTTPFGDGALTLERLTGEERLAAPFDLRLEMRSEKSDLDFATIVGKTATVELVVSEGASRYFHGVVTRFVQGPSDQRTTRYYADLRPTLWMLKLTADCRIFQNMTAPEIIEQVFKDFGLTDFKDSLKKTYAAREYCVQYRETAFDFVSRLMEEEGIFYFFAHESGKHTLVLADDPDTYPACPGDAKAVYRPDLVDAWQVASVVRACTLEQQVRTGKVAFDDYNFETPSTDLLASADGGGTLRLFDYPGQFAKKDAGEDRAKLVMEALEWPEKRLTGSGFCRGFVSGHTFELAEHERDDVNAKYALTWVSHAATRESYENAFEAIPALVPFHPTPRFKKPVIAGAQTAVVVGKSGEEIWTDKYGRIKVQFHWDQVGKNDENSSCWVRVAQGWAGKSWGGWFLPRIGQEVVVSFLEGDPDRPLVTGSVYNAEQTVPYTLPDDQTKSTVKSNVSKGGGGFNEIRFEDKKDAEEIFVYAQKDMNITVKHDRTKTVFNDETITIKKNRTTTIEEEHESLTVAKGNRKVIVTKGDEVHEVGGTRALKVTKAETHKCEDDFTQEVTKNYVLKVTGDITIQATGKVTLKSGQDFGLDAGAALAIKSKMDFKQNAGMSLLTEAKMSIKTKAGMNLENEAQMQLKNKAALGMTNDGGVMLTSKASAMHTVEGGAMLSLKGGILKIN